MISYRAAEHEKDQHGHRMIKGVYQAVSNQALNYYESGHDLIGATSESQKQLVKYGFESSITKNSTHLCLF